MKSTSVLTSTRTYFLNKKYLLQFAVHTGKSLSEALILASTHPQYDGRLFMDLPVQYVKTTSSEHKENMGRTCKQHVLPIF